MEGNTITLMYPQISDYHSTGVEDRVNQCLFDFAFKMYEKADLFATDDGGYEYITDIVEITLQTEDFLSAYVGGRIVSAYNGYTEYFSYTINCRLSTAELYSTEDIISDYDRFSSQFYKGHFTQAFGYTDLDEQISFKDMLAQYKTDYGIYPSVYFTNEGIGVLLDVVPVLDGYAGFTCPISRIKSSLNKDNPLVSCITGQL